MQHRNERVYIETERHRISGVLTLARDGYRSRVSDFLNASEREFIALTDVVVELVDRDDEMAQRLLAAKREGLHDDYGRGTFERLLGERFDVERTEELAGGRRVLYLARPR